MKFDQILDNPLQWQHKDANVRLKCIKNNGLTQTVLVRIANNDEDIAVRLAAIDQLKQQKTSVVSASEVRAKNLNHQLLQFKAALDEGKIKQAHKIQLGIGRKIQDSDAPKKLRLMFETYSLKLIELKDWQGFATIPKREALCEEMAGLAENESLSESIKAEQIKDLQNQWKNLGASDSYQAQKLWRKFKKIGERAYEPCAKYFSAQKEIRSKNLREKEKICDALESLASKNERSEKSWTSADWKKFAEILAEAQKEWRRFDEISRKKYKRIQLRYKTILDILHGKINSEKSANHQLRSDLIEEAKMLLTLDIRLPEKIEQIKALQVDWKAVGITERVIDQKLWKKFRLECDKIFELRSEETKAKKRDLLAEVKAAQNIYELLKELVESDKHIVSVDIKRLRTAFKKETSNKDKQAFEHVIHAFQDQIDKAKARLVEQSVFTKQSLLIELKRRAALCNAYELGDLSLEKVEASWEVESPLSSELSDRLKQRLYNSAPVNLEEKERLCIRLEILAEIESPEESQEAKLTYQVERLNKELSKGQKETRSVTEQISEIQTHWYCLSCNRESASLSKRFTIAEAKLCV